jgi:hypothetical protein
MQCITREHCEAYASHVQHIDDGLTADTADTSVLCLLSSALWYCKVIHIACMLTTSLDGEEVPRMQPTAIATSTGNVAIDRTPGR